MSQVSKTKQECFINFNFRNIFNPPAGFGDQEEQFYADPCESRRNAVVNEGTIEAYLETQIAEPQQKLQPGETSRDSGISESSFEQAFQIPCHNGSSASLKSATENALKVGST